MDHSQLRDVVEDHARWIASRTQRGARARLSGQRLHATNLESADLRWAHLQDTHWTEARLAGAKLVGADLRGADLRGARLVHHVGFNELDLPRVFLAANLTGALLEGARVALDALEGTGANGPHMQVGDLGDLAEPVPPPPVASPTPPSSWSFRGHERDTLCQLAQHVVRALPELSPLAAALDSPAWVTGLDDGLDTYEVFSIGDRPKLTVRLGISRCDSSAGPVVTGRQTSIHVIMPNGDPLVLGWSGSGGLTHRLGDPRLFERVCSLDSVEPPR